MTQSLFDSQRFLQSLADDDELARELLAAFMEDSPQRSTSLAQALDANDGEAAAKLAHSLKGMCGVVRTEDLSTLALSMEHTAKNGELDKTRELYSTFADKLDKVHEEMNAYLAR